MAHDLGDLEVLFAQPDRYGSVASMRADRLARELEVVIDTSGYDVADARRVIACRDAMRWSLRDERFGTVRLAVEHPALLDLTDERAELYFTGAPADPEATREELQLAHARVVGRFLDLGAVVNGLAGSLDELLAAGRGLLATGPWALLLAYAEVLDADGVKTSLLPAPRPDGPSPPFAVLELGRSWIVAKAFTVRSG